MKRPRIGIPTGYARKTRSHGQSRDYLDAIVGAGGVPVMIPLLRDPSVLGEYVAAIDGLLLAGSPTDIDPLCYGCKPHEKLGRLFPEREHADFTLLELAEATRLPVLGVCFGLQSLNVYRGGTLVQDIPSEWKDPVRHDLGRAPLDSRCHIVRFTKDSRLARLIGSRVARVNSDHHQAVRTTGRHLRPTAFVPDGLIEAVEDTRDTFVFGVQWHPERVWSTDQVSRALFRELISAARKARRRPRGGG